MYILIREDRFSASSMTIPSALTLIVYVFPDPFQQAWAIGLFGGCGAVAAGEESTCLIIYDGPQELLVFGLLIGAMFVEWASYHWVFWFVAIVAIVVALLACVFVIQLPVVETSRSLKPQTAKWKSLDLIGVTLLTGMVNLTYSSVYRSRVLIVALILFIFAVSSGSIYGWGSAIVLVPLITSVFMVVGFLYWETLMPVEQAAM